ncbi:hypothetical protein EV421DRAFT_1906816 [Armillaria borealis]|uniref:Uncharacterized protein n=1 Tax=Armillaria borealis TaxID=47425 RepID=A0AA39J8U6_9AGAR|nr:hypothetical protein EV421DRAFT_1906816 [Armillaria borealis]
MSKQATNAPKTSGLASTCDYRNIVLGKVRGYPLLARMVVDPNDAPQQDLDDNLPVIKQISTLCNFSPPAISPKDISKLQQHGSKAYIKEPFIYSDDLLMGYKGVLDPSGWEKRKAEQAEAAASGGVLNEVDQLDSKNEEKPKKRKQNSEGGISARKRKTSMTGDVKKVPLKGKKGGKKENVESKHDGEADEDIGTSKKGTSPPPAKKAKRDKEVHDESDVVNDPETLKVHEWRYRLQKMFLSNRGNPKEERMPEMDKLFHTVEAYQSVTIHYLMGSSLGATVNSVFFSDLFRFFFTTSSVECACP